MDATQRELSEQIDQATQRLLGSARAITEPELQQPSLLPGWTRAHVLAHLARGADAMRYLLIGARIGQERPAYVSAQARDADIAFGGTLAARELLADLARSALAFRTIIKQTPDDAWQFRVRMLDSAPFPAAQLLTRRLVEIELHHGDLGTGYGPAHWPTSFAVMELAEPMQSLRQDRIDHAWRALPDRGIPGRSAAA